MSDLKLQTGPASTKQIIEKLIAEERIKELQGWDSTLQLYIKPKPKLLPTFIYKFLINLVFIQKDMRS